MPPKPHLHKIDGRLPTASEVARARKLAEIGKDLDWYYAQVEASKNEHGTPCCQACGFPEQKRLPSGDIKPLSIDTRNVRLICARCANTQYKASMRAKVARRQDREGVPTLEEFWTRNRKKLSAEERSTYEEREVQVIGLDRAIRGYMQDFDPATEEEDLRDVIREVCRDVVDYGFIESNITLVPFFKPEMKEFFDTWTSGKVAPEYAKATPLYMNYGYLTSLSEHHVHLFIAFAERHLGLPISGCVDYPTRIQRILDALEGKIYKTPDRVIECSTTGCKNLVAATERFCADCEAEGDKRARQVLARFDNQRLANQRADTVNSLKTHDKWGRKRDQIVDDEGKYGSPN